MAGGLQKWRYPATVYSSIGGWWNESPVRWKRNLFLYATLIVGTGIPIYSLGSESEVSMTMNGIRVLKLFNAAAIRGEAVSQPQALMRVAVVHLFLSFLKP